MKARRLARPAARPALLAAGLLLAAAGPLAAASAREASAPEVRELASKAAAGDRSTLAELRRVDRVDGRNADLGEWLRRGSPNLRIRLRALAAGPAGQGPDAGVARARVREVLADARYHEPSFPRPLRGVFAWIGTRLEPVVRKLGELIRAIASVAPGGRPVGFTLLAALVLVAFAAMSSRTLRTRSRRRAAAALRAHARAHGPSPDELERAAADAERTGDLSLAVRLLFRAGLLRLDQLGTIRLHPALTTAAVARRLDSREFTAIAVGFDEVVYGGRPAAASDVEAQRAGWRRVLAEVRA